MIDKMIKACRYLLIILLVHAVSTASTLDGETFNAGKNYVRGQIWPKPREELRTETFLSLSPDKFEMKSIGKNSDILTDALKRYFDIVFPDKDVPASTEHSHVNVLRVDVLYDAINISLSTDES